MYRRIEGLEARTFGINGSQDGVKNIEDVTNDETTQLLASFMEETARRFRAAFPTAQNLVMQGIFDDSKFVGTIQTTTDNKGRALIGKVPTIESVTTQNP